MIKRILFIILMVIVTYFLSFAVMYNETLASINTVINNAIDSNDFTDILKYNAYYKDTPMYYYEDEDYVVQINNSYSEETQSLTIIVVDKLKTQGEKSALIVTCEETYTYTNIFSEYDDASITVVTLFKEGTGEYALGSDCSLGFFENLLVKSNDGEIIVSLDNQIGFIDEQDILNDEVGFTVEEIEAIQYPNGMVRPLILPIGTLWISVFALIYIYKKFFKKNKK